MRKNRKVVLIIFSLCFLVLLSTLGIIRIALNPVEQKNKEGVYYELPADQSTEDPLKYIGENFLVKEGFHSNLPIVILTIEGELSNYKSFVDSKEVVDESVNPYSNGKIRILDSGMQTTYLNDEAIYQSDLKIKKKGHTSFSYDKSQYLMKMTDSNGEENKTDILGMGEGDSWILNGSMADKSGLRNYLAYRIASEVGGSKMAPDSRYCEMLLENNGEYEYCGVYLLMETVSRGENRVNIDSFNEHNSYSSYIIRRDRFTEFDVMLDTYGRLKGFSPEWIGIKYPSKAKITEVVKEYIEDDFSKIEMILYSDEEAMFKTYDKYIDSDSFVDYFLINEYFGNYDAGEHSTYMYKNTGEDLFIGPVWDFDQAMNNYFQDDMDPYTLAFQTKPLFEQLSKDTRFINYLQERYSSLRETILSEEHVFAVMDEVINYLKSARIREWYRWSADYMDGSFSNPGNYYLQDYQKEGVLISRFNDEYEQEILTIRTYLHKHGKAIPLELTKLHDLTEFDTSILNEKALLLIIIMTLFIVPSIIINRK